MTGVWGDVFAGAGVLVLGACPAAQDSVDFVVKKLDFLTADEGDWLMRRTAEEFFFKKK